MPLVKPQDKTFNFNRTGLSGAYPDAVATVDSLLPQLGSIRTVVFCCFSAGDLAVYCKLLADGCDKPA